MSTVRSGKKPVKMNRYGYYDEEDPQAEWQAKRSSKKQQRTVKEERSSSESPPDESYSDVDTIKSMPVELPNGRGSASFEVDDARKSPYSYSGPMSMPQSGNRSRASKEASRENSFSHNTRSAFDKPVKNPPPETLPKPKKRIETGEHTSNDNKTVSEVEQERPNPGRVMYIDENYQLQPLEDEKEIVELLKKSSLHALTKNMSEAIQQLTTMSADRLNHFAALGQHMGHLQKNELFFDVSITVGTHTFRAHRVVLSCFSKYFFDAFVTAAAKGKVPLEMKLGGITSDALKLFLDFAYSGSIELKPEIIGELAIAAEFLDIPILKEKTAEFMNEITADEALVVIETGKVPTSTDIYRKSYECIMEHFTDCYDTNAFNNLSLEHLITILKDDRIIVFTEMDVFWAGLKWISYQMNDRSKYLNQVMECVRFPYLSQSEIFKCLETTDLLKTSEKCKQSLIAANWIISSEEKRKTDLLNLPKPPKRYCFRKGHNVASLEAFVSMTDDLALALPELRGAFSCEVYHSGTDLTAKFPQDVVEEPVLFARPSSPGVFNGDIITIGGFQSDNSKTNTIRQMQRYSLGDGQWKYYGELPEPRHHHAVALLNGKIYLVGGVNPKRTLRRRSGIATSNVYQYDPDIKMWRICASMNSSRMDHKLCALYGMLYALGGENDKKHVLASVECYNPKINAWVYVHPMNWPRVGMSAVACDGKIYVAGGHGEKVGKNAKLPVLQSMESFDPRNNQWTALADLRVPRCFAGLGAIHSKLYMSGGVNIQESSKEEKSIGLIDVYDTRLDVWNFKTDMIIPRHGHAVAVIGSKMYMIGGMSTTNNKILKSVECYDVVLEGWDNSVQDLPQPARWISSVVLPVGVQRDKDTAKESKKEKEVFKDPVDDSKDQ